jgi:hypothetical protein
VKSLHKNDKNEGKPEWFSLIARAASPQALLPFRYAVGICSISHYRQRLGVEQNKVAAGMNPAAIATLATKTTNMRENPNCFPSSRSRPRRRRCSHSGNPARHRDAGDMVKPLEG